MKKIGAALFLVILFLTGIPCKSQWLQRASNSVGNWRISAANNGVLFNNGTVPGAIWPWPQAKNQSLIFGAGLGLGGRISTYFGTLKSSTVSYYPDNGKSEFCPGSFLSKVLLLTLASLRMKNIRSMNHLLIQVNGLFAL